MDPILIVEDDSDLSELIKIQLLDQDFQIEQSFNHVLKPLVKLEDGATS